MKTALFVFFRIVFGFIFLMSVAANLGLWVGIFPPRWIWVLHIALIVFGGAALLTGLLPRQRRLEHSFLRRASSLWVRIPGAILIVYALANFGWTFCNSWNQSVFEKNGHFYRYDKTAKKEFEISGNEFDRQRKMELGTFSSMWMLLSFFVFLELKKPLPPDASTPDARSADVRRKDMK